MKDFLGNELHVGDKVVYINGFYGSSQGLATGIIERCTPCFAYAKGHYKRIQSNKIMKLED